MVTQWGLKSLWFHKGQTLSSILGIAFSFLLAMFFAGVWQGETEQIVAYPQKVKPDIWVMQKGVSNMHMAMSFVWDWKADVIEEIPGVKQVTPFIYVNSIIHLNDNKMFGFIVGLLSAESRAGPWEITEGRMLESDDEVIVPAELATIYNTKINDLIQIIDQKYRIVGFSEGTYSTANPVLFTLKPKLERSLGSFGTYSYLLVDSTPGTNIELLLKKIQAEVNKVNVLSHQEFIRNDFAMASQMGVDIIFIMTLICISLATLIIGYASYSLVLRKQKEIAIIKAMGATNRRLLMTVALQSALISLLAYLVALVLLYILELIIPLVAPQISLSLTNKIILQPALLAVMTAVVGSGYPAIKILHLDPALVYQNG
ncbi:ABC transporter permease [Kangiella shandongensis]|uniref:ABC transporter permease n=1 Tax=Kangiella shandongensis TaxID=2763258 RepID=UPI001CBE7F6A|nr:ABC transporter permease [Kangiella shandongensis]